MKILKLFCCILLKLSVSNAQNSQKPRIAFGEDAKITDYPFFAGLEYCGASILSNKWLLTAGHCVDNRKAMGRKLVFLGGERVGNSLKNTFDLVLTHPAYNPLYKGVLANDVALLRLKYPLTFSNTVQPVKLPLPGAVSANLRYTLVARGLDETHRLSTSLKKMDVRELSFQECKSKSNPEYHRFLKNKNIFCTRRLDNRAGMCQGDSGSPLVQNDIVVGISSFIMAPQDDCKRTNTGFYTNIAMYVDWIVSVINS